jgi:outer membrane protein TolC
MSTWMSDAEKRELLTILENRYRNGAGQRDDILRVKMELEATEAQWRAAIAGERNAKYMLWSIVGAAVSAVAALISTAIAVFGHH